MRRAIILAAAIALAADWPRFRGPNGTGIGEGAPTNWTATENRLWKADLPGKGNGSPIIVKGKVFVQSAAANGSTRSLVCLDAITGKELWTKTQTGQTAKTHAKNSLASSTPASDGERVFACFWDGRGVSLTAYTLDGSELWSEKLGPFASQHGAGMSPIVHAGKVFVNFDSDDAAEVMAFDAATGKKAWGQKRKVYRACYSTPVVRELGNGAAEIVVLSTAGLTAYEPTNGKVNWDCPIPWGDRPLRSVASPVLVDGVYIIVTGDGDGSRLAGAVKPGPSPSLVWHSRSSKLAPYVPCPVTVGKHLVWLTDHGVLECVDPLTGKATWSEPVFSTSVSASPILLGDVLLMIDERGNAIAGKVNEKGFTQLSKSAVGESVYATPAAADGRLYLRTATAVICIAAK